MDYLIGGVTILVLAIVFGTVVELGGRWIDRMFSVELDPSKPIVKRLPDE